MNILSVHTGHDASASLYKDYKLVATYKEERLSRIKQDGRKLPLLSLNKIKEVIDFSEIDVFLFNKFIFNRKYFRHLSVIKRFFNSFVSDEEKIKNIISYLGLKKNIELFQYNHHFAHGIPTLFYNKKWNNSLIYTADGGGDFGAYSIYFFNGKELEPIYEDKPKKDNYFNSLGLLYNYVTKALGFKPNRHEGKITGLAAFGSYTKVVEDIKDLFYVKEGIILSNIKSGNDIKKIIFSISKRASREDLSFAVQKVLEDLIVESICQLRKKYKFSNIGLSGGVFANVKLNQRVSELDFIEDMFVLPPMGDEGLVVGGTFEYLINKNGFDSFLSERVLDMELPYWGEEFKILKNNIPDKFKIVKDIDIVKSAVELLKENKILAIFTKGMEFGPRALGARSIIINPSDRKINDVVNKRLNRTEFMPFAPYVREERVKDIFDFPVSSLRAMKYMTVTCNVKNEWREKIQATVHVDNTARPQTIKRDDNILYYDILHYFEKETGIPCLVNTSFNAHEEPIINTFKEALNALKDRRIDYLVTDLYIIELRS